MDRKQVKELLSDYNRKKLRIESINTRLEAYREALRNPTAFGLEVLKSGNGLGFRLPKDSVTECEVMKCLTIEESIEELKKLIANDESRIFFLQKSIDQVDTALKLLSDEEREVVELKFFHDMNWAQIEYSYNKEKIDNDIRAQKTLHAMCAIALDKIMNFFNETV